MIGSAYSRIGSLAHFSKVSLFFYLAVVLTFSYSFAVGKNQNWYPSKYGKNDQHGSLNEITPSKVVRASRLVKTGKVYDLGRVVEKGIPAFGRRYFEQTLVSSSHILNRRGKPEDATSTGMGDNKINWITEIVSGTFQIGTQLDGLNHLQIGERFYNGYKTSDIVEVWGTSKLGIETVPPVITRGILLDIASLKGVTMLKKGYVITVSDIKQALKREHLKIKRGDAVIFHTGWGSLWLKNNSLFVSGEPGVGMEGAEYLVGKSIAMTGADTWSYGPVPPEDSKRPFEVPQTLNVKHGTFVMEVLKTEDLAKDKAYEFMFVLTHHKTKGSTAAIIAPAAIR